MPLIIAMIPARMGSKRVPQKNIRLLHGTPLIQYAIDAAIESGCFDEIWVNSESVHLGTLATQCGVEFHKRPEELATDTATNQDFTAEFLRRHECDFVVMINPTSPLLKPETIRRFCEYVRTGDSDTVLSVLEERAEFFYRKGPVNFTTSKKINSQDLEPVHKVVWAMTAWRREYFLSIAEQGKCSVFAGRVGLFPIPIREAIDIDTQEEWDLAEGMLLAEKFLLNKGQTKPLYWGNFDEE